MRQLKFRAWQPSQKKMHNEIGLHPHIMCNHTMCDEDECGYVAEGTGRGEYTLFANQSEWPIMQFTGLKDKSGKEIYEGDVISIDGTSEYEQCTPKPKKDEYVGVFVVKHESWSHGYEFTWYNVSGYECSTHIMGSADDAGVMANVVVIGNIYENPDLL